MLNLNTYKIEHTLPLRAMRVTQAHIFASGTSWYLIYEYTYFESLHDYPETTLEIVNINEGNKMFKLSIDRSVINRFRSMVHKQHLLTTIDNFTLAVISLTTFETVATFTTDNVITSVCVHNDLIYYTGQSGVIGKLEAVGLIL